MWDGLDPSVPEKTAKITYHKGSKEAKGIYLPVMRELRLWKVVFYFSTYKIWKRPV